MESQIEDVSVRGISLLTSSDKIDQLAVALVAAQLEMPAVKKKRTNPFFKSKYADLAECVGTAGPVIGAQGLAVTQLIGHRGADTTLKTILLHKSGQWIGEEMLLCLPKHTPQDQGSAVTYAKRYAYCAILGIVADDDNDGNFPARGRPTAKSATSQAKEPTGSSGPTTRVKAPARQAGPYIPAAVRKLTAMLKGIGVSEEDGPGWAAEVLGRPVAALATLGGEEIARLEQAVKGSKGKSRAYAEDDPARPF